MTMKLTRLLIAATSGSILVLLGACRDETNDYGGDVNAAERAEDAAERMDPLPGAEQTADERARAADERGGMETSEPREASYADAEDAPQRARVDLQQIGASGVTGVVHFERTGDTLHIQGRIEGLTPGKHGFHVHEFGDLSDTQTGESAGSHFAPEGNPHGLQDADTRHVGDLGNIEAGEDGVAVIDIRDAHVKLHGEHSIIGRALVVHENEDDGGQPTGNAGGRVAFGVVVADEPAAEPR
jgi:Cu-Zn family superoxide dismutase